MYNEVEFYKYGCLPRCLIHLHGKITCEEFCEKYEALFRSEYGMIQDDKIDQVVSDMGFEWVGATKDFDVAKNHFLNYPTAIIRSEVSLTKGSTEPNFHASVLKGINDQAFVLWTSSQDG